MGSRRDWAGQGGTLCICLRASAAASLLAVGVDVAGFPARYEPLDQLGSGGGGEVWSARDRITGQIVALKLLRHGGDEAELLALVREATTLSGVEGLGVPRVLHFGRLPQSGRAFMVRELVEGRSLADLLDSTDDPDLYLSAVAQAADLLTRLHRASLLHGDIKPANIIVSADGSATLVDLGLAAHWQDEGGAKAEGLTPRYAAPELFAGAPLTPRAEVFSLGASVGEMLRMSAALREEARAAVDKVVARATAEDPAARYPSADEFAQALRAAVPGARGGGELAAVWSVVGIDAICADLLQRIRALPKGGGLVVVGGRGSGRSTLLRRVSWSLGVAGVAVAMLQTRRGARDLPGRSAEPVAAGEPTKLEADLEAVLSLELTGRKPHELVLIVDDADERSDQDLARLNALREAGSTLVMVATGSEAAARLPGRTFRLFQVPPLDAALAAALVRRMIPSLGSALVEHIIRRTGCLPGPMRALVSRLEGTAVVAVEDVDRRLAEVPLRTACRVGPIEIHRLLDRGRFDDAAEALAAYGDDAAPTIAIARAKLATGRGQAREAIALLGPVAGPVEAAGDGELAAAWHLQLARALLRAGDYDDCEKHAQQALARLAAVAGAEAPGAAAAAPHSARDLFGSSVTAMASDAQALCGLAQSFCARHEQARASLERSVELARQLGDPRTLSVAFASLAFALQRGDKLDEAQRAHEQALVHAEQAGDAGSVATTRLNLAGIAHMRGDIAGAIEHLKAAVDMGRRSGRESTVHQALLNLAQLDLYLGRHVRARASIETLAQQRERLAPAAQAQLLGLEGESAAVAGELAHGAEACRQCACAYEKLGRSVDAAEALLERVLLLARSGTESAEALAAEIERGSELLSDSGAHRALLATARGRVAMRSGRLDLALGAFEEALAAARDSGQREWLWRALESRAALMEATGQQERAARDRARALAELEQIAAELPPDLREVYWNDPRRRALRGPGAGAMTLATPPAATVRRPAAGGLTVASPGLPAAGGARASLEAAEGSGGVETAATQLFGPVPEDRLARVLEVNREIAGEHDLDRLLERVTDHAIALFRAERGFVLLRSRSGEDRLSIHAARAREGDDPHVRFSESIARRVVDTGQSFVAIDAGRDERVADYVSVHQLMLKSVACAPIRARTGQVIGALYLETRLRPGESFSREMPTLGAFADQVAIAIETTRLIGENEKRARELEKANAELEEARAKLEELLGRRTEQLAATRKDLRDAHAALRGHFGYQGVVGNSPAMHRLFGVMERVKGADVPLLITGESGTGKEVVARAIHRAGPRVKHRMVGVNCGAIPEHLLESELFGHMKGAFTGADRDKKGLFRELDGGTILLDEIGEMPPKMQAGLLRVLQEKVVRPVGGTKEEPVDVRVIAATHRHLAEMVEGGRFREDLYYRLNVISMHVPALRERIEDLPLLIDHFLRLFAARYERDRRTVSRAALKRLMAYDWPGNVRQLENVLLNAWILSDHAELDPEDFELPEARPRPRPAPAAVSPHPTTLGAQKEHERERMLEALAACNWNRAKAAAAIGMPRRTFYRRLKEFGIQ
ncbi:MAG: sigma 54-interacting transcriptional regulator [Deltaproteobacteria bacterium]|nr:sigma 54-interacting transcriptional regulator [Deltaproteobacteria bacterium]